MTNLCMNVVKKIGVSPIRSNLLFFFNTLIFLLVLLIIAGDKNYSLNCFFSADVIKAKVLIFLKIAQMLC